LGFVFRNNAEISAIIDVLLYNNIGVGLFITATIGDITLHSIADISQSPNAVAALSVGNRDAVIT
jgi:predicted lactoylglutathione lyase